MVTTYDARRQSSFPLLVISTGFFVLAVLFSIVGGAGFYVSLALLVVGGFSMIAVGMKRDVRAKSIVSNQDNDSEDGLN